MTRWSDRQFESRTTVWGSTARGSDLWLDATEPWIDPVVELLAFFGLAEFPVRGRGVDRRLGRHGEPDVRQRGWRKAPGSNEPRRFVWPAWQQPLDASGVDALLDIWNPWRTHTLGTPRHSRRVAERSVSAQRKGGQHQGHWSRETVTPELVHIRGIEGDAARIYFRALEQVVAATELGFSSRTRRPPRDPINALLSFCYGLVVTECTGALESVGLDYQMGFFHRPRAGRPSLALDLAEELRALMDRFVVSLVRRRQIGSGSFKCTPGGGVYLRDDARTAPHPRRGKTTRKLRFRIASSGDRWVDGRPPRSRRRCSPAICVEISACIRLSFFHDPWTY